MSATNLTTPCRVSIYWDRMDAWFAATVRSQDAATGRYEVLYDDDNETEFMFLAPVDAEGVARARGAPCRLVDATPPVDGSWDCACCVLVHVSVCLFAV